MKIFKQLWRRSKSDSAAPQSSTEPRRPPSAEVRAQQRVQMITDALSELTPEELEDFLRCGRGAAEVKKHFGVQSFRTCYRGNYGPPPAIPTAAGLRGEAEMLRRLCEEAGIEPAARSSSADESSD